MQKDQYLALHRSVRMYEPSAVDFLDKGANRSLNQLDQGAGFLH